MKVYLAGSCSSECRTMMQSIAAQLKKEGHVVYCPFELQIKNAWDMTQEEWAKKVFKADLKALDQCDLVLIISPGRISSAGTNWEQGYAFAKGKVVFVLQYTDKSTSLMTYCSANQFRNCTEKELMDNVMAVVRREQAVCKTILT